MLKFTNKFIAINMRQQLSFLNANWIAISVVTFVACSTPAEEPQSLTTNPPLPEPIPIASPTSQPTATVTNLQAVTASEDGIGDGVWLVGEEIKPGTYQAPGKELCYWARLRGFSGDSKDIIAYDATSGKTIVAILESDLGF